MPTYDYLCRSCGHEEEYRDVPSDSHPECAGCGGTKGMHRLPSRVNIGTQFSRKASLEDTLGSILALKSVEFVTATCPHGKKVPVVKLGFKEIRENGPCMN